MIDQQDELHKLFNRSTILFTKFITGMAEGQIRGAPNKEKENLSELADLIHHSMMLADILGRKRVYMQVDHIERTELSSEMNRLITTSIPDVVLSETTPIVPHVPFQEAIDDLISREPRIANSIAEMQEVYRKHGLSLARRANDQMISEIQDKIVQFRKEGVTVPQAAELLEGMGQRAGVKDFTRAYGETVYRNAVSTSYSAGMFRLAQDPEVSSVMPAMEYAATRDADVRANHLAADGLIAPTTHDVWLRFSTPMGHNCRCSLLMVDRFDYAKLQDDGRLTADGVFYPPNFSQAGPDRGFETGRPDTKIYS